MQRAVERAGGAKQVGLGLPGITSFLEIHNEYIGDGGEERREGGEERKGAPEKTQRAAPKEQEQWLIMKE